MRRYRTVILVLLFGVVPMLLLLVLAVTVILPALEEPVAEVEPVTVVAQAPPPAPVLKRIALVIDRPVPAGTLLTTGDLSLQDIGDRDLPEADDQYVYVREVEGWAAAESSRNMLRGFAARQPLAAGEPVARAAVVAPDDAQFLATVLAANRVAVSIPVSLATRQAKVVSPGNRVDVLLAVEQRKAMVVRTIVEDVRVLAVNSRIITEEDVRPDGQPRTDAAQQDRSDGGQAPVRPDVLTVTLEVLPVQAEHLALGAHEGQLSLAIRPLAHGPRRLDEPVQTLRKVLQLPEEPAAETVLPPPQPIAVRVVRGSETQTVVFKAVPDGAAETPEAPVVDGGGATAVLSGRVQ